MAEERADTAVEMHLVGVSNSAGAFQGASDTALYGSACTAKGISVAAINHVRGHPENNSFSERRELLRDELGWTPS